MTKKKKIWLIVLVSFLGVCLVSGIIFSIISAVNKVKRTQGAQILLAREKMHEEQSHFSWQTILDNNQSTSLNAMIDSNQNEIATLLNSADLGEEKHNSPAGKVYLKNGEYNFQNISGASYTGNVILSRLHNIEFRVQSSAEMINYLKNELNIVDKWVKQGYSKYYLNVKESCETLIEYYEDDKGLKSLNVMKRETTANAKSIYTLLLAGMEIGKVENPVALRYCANERYEYYYGHEGNATDYLIAENENGYWNIFMPNEDDFQNTIVSDNFAFTNSIDYGKSITAGRIINSTLKNDIAIIGSEGISFNISEFNGIKGIFAPEDVVYCDTYDGGEKNYYSIERMDSNKIRIELNNGKTFKLNDTFTYGTQTVQIDDLTLDFFPNPGFADPQYAVSMHLSMSTNTQTQAVELFKPFLSDMGLTCKHNIDTLLSSMQKNLEISNTLQSFYKWNGYLMNSTENFKKAEKVIFDLNTAFEQEYIKVKDAEVVEAFFAPKLARNQNFASIYDLSTQDSAYENGKITIDNIKLKLKKNDLLENQKSYVLQIGLARVDNNGNFLSENTVALKTESQIPAFTFSSNDMELNASATYDIPLALEEGKYLIVAYIATQNDLIRVSEMQRIGFADTINDEISTFENIILIGSENGGLCVTSTPKLYFQIEATPVTTYNQLRRIMMAEVLSHGYPKYNEEIKKESGDYVHPSDQIINGTYNLKFTLPTLNGDVTAYVSLVVTNP